MEMMERVEMAFAEMMESAGLEFWWESESYWEEWEDEMVASGLNAGAVEEFFSVMACDM